ncbi:MCP methyltransferase, CheR-type [Methanosalsum zhilinae DSM 4017]|uniref:protein-glutamate O-methyltransferase n=1 Tax=Methanosalsum zhilinae (strain DSM 4017 / NBRC 107636 / OCM 62 / WeN5) TaxID=679901 RepID=F7XQE5_METZD|nr:protein-glutamate O-methyltransferase CheR [Methanosalsum zhilinae]AEH60446.1 MCP methyltransferase, CheR-type [Methanosalsum zhilinae DSM 4017]
MDNKVKSLCAEDDAEFTALKKVINRKIGFNCDQYKISHFKRRIDIRLRATKCSGYSNYAEYLKNNPKEVDALTDTLTVNVTEFFRNQETYQALEDEVLPAIISSKRNKSINIWSAGCSIGVEAYSVAMLLHKFLGNDFRRYRIKIIGTDIDKKSLKKAEDGIYGASEIKNLTDVFLGKYFICGENEYQVIDEIKNMTTFQHHDLISGEDFRDFDLILCRNVTIYFERDLQEKLYSKFYNALNKDGFFVIGKTETLVGPSKDLFVPFNIKERIYSR